MRVLIVTPAPYGSTKGNRITAERWAGFVQQLGHDIHVADKLVDGQFDCLVTLHATRSHDVIVSFQKRCPGRPVILCMTGTDLHLDLQGLRGEEASRRAADSVQRSSHVVLLEPESARSLPDEIQNKVSVILQSANPVDSKPSRRTDRFEISVVGHLRKEKDPFLTSRATRCLPEVSRIRISHFGAALDPDMAKLAADEMESNPRYHWFGPLPHSETQRHLARSRLMVLSSKIEGAPSAISEAIVNQVPILATEIPASVGLLGCDYPGLFPVGDVFALSKLLVRAESDPSFLDDLTLAVEQLAPRFAPDIELNNLERLLFFCGGFSSLIL